MPDRQLSSPGSLQQGCRRQGHEHEREGDPMGSQLMTLSRCEKEGMR
jgi:hypothetical protein